MFWSLFILLNFGQYFVKISSMGCTDWRGNRIKNGVEFRSRQDPCETCTCEEGHSVRCMSVHCAAPKCSLWEMIEGECCQFHCLEPADAPRDKNGKINISSIDHTIIHTEAIHGENVGLRLIASTVTSFLILALLLFMVHRLRQRRILIMMQMQRMTEDSNNDDTLAYQIDTGYEFSPYEEPPPPYTPPKPPYIPLGEAPPPYDQINNNNFGEIMGSSANGNDDFQRYNSTTNNNMHMTNNGIFFSFPRTYFSKNMYPHPQMACMDFKYEVDLRKLYTRRNKNSFKSMLCSSKIHSAKFALLHKEYLKNSACISNKDTSSQLVRCTYNIVPYSNVMLADNIMVSNYKSLPFSTVKKTLKRLQCKPTLIKEKHTKKFCEKKNCNKCKCMNMKKLVDVIPYKNSISNNGIEALRDEKINFQSLFLDSKIHDFYSHLDETFDRNVKHKYYPSYKRGINNFEMFKMSLDLQN